LTLLVAVAASAISKLFQTPLALTAAITAAVVAVIGAILVAHGEDDQKAMKPRRASGQQDAAET
jgi:hypothetical protein